ncbi:hypothetical protein ACMHYB_12045 [Sorangium sp. So ce1128]
MMPACAPPVALPASNVPLTMLTVPPFASSAIDDFPGEPASAALASAATTSRFSSRLLPPLSVRAMASAGPWSVARASGDQVQAPSHAVKPP